MGGEKNPVYENINDTHVFCKWQIKDSAQKSIQFTVVLNNQQIPQQPAMKFFDVFLYRKHNLETLYWIVGGKLHLRNFWKHSI